MRTTLLLLIAILSMTAIGVHAAGSDASPLRLAAKGPGTQTEDELYIGSRAKAAPANATATKTGQAKQTDKGGKPRKISDEDPKALEMQRRTGDEDLEDLEVQRMKMQQNAR
jgi:hypothetical protein